MSDWEDDNCMAICNNYQSVNETDGKNEAGWNEPQSTNSDDAISFEIAQSNVGMVIGRGGSKIREIEEKYQVKLQIGENILQNKPKKKPLKLLKTLFYRQKSKRKWMRFSKY